MAFIRSSLLFLLVLSLIAACDRGYTPKPRGIMKVEYPEKAYIRFDTTAPFSFDIPVYSSMQADTLKNAEKWWYNLVIPSLDATIYLSYKNVNNNLNTYIEDSRTLAYKHTIKADAINEIMINYPERRVYGILYDLRGNTASSLQFFLTDSTENFLRGSLYFNSSPEKDSLAPVISFIRKDVDHLISTLEWKKPG
jgi:gliding motility-associated lipoprotein GldD